MTRFNSLLPWLIASGLFLYIIWSDGNIRQLSGFRSPPSIFSARNEDYDPAFHFLIAQSHRTDALCYQLQLFFQYGYFDPIMIAYTGVSYHTQWIETNKAKIPNTTEWLRAHTRERDIGRSVEYHPLLCEPEFNYFILFYFWFVFSPSKSSSWTAVMCGRSQDRMRC